VRVPRVQRMGRRALQEAGAAAMLAEQGLRFPFLLRSPGFHTGEHFLRVESPQGLRAALVQLPGEDFLALEYLDARGADGKTRKYRVMMIGGELMPLHLAIAADWKVHYFSADMARNERHRAEEARFLERMPEVLGERAMRALQRIQLLLGLEYAGIDFALGKDGELIVFEANATMNIVPAAPEAMWAYRRSAVERADAAVRRLLMGERALSPADAAGGRDGVVVGPGPSPGPAAVMRAAPAGQSAEFLAEDLALGANELNFSAGPGALPLAVLQEAQQAILALPETGLSVLGMSHRSAWFEALLQEAEANLRRLLDIPASHAVLFLQGGSSLQFSMIPQNFAAGRGAEPLHLRTGYWSAKAIEEGRCARPLQVAWDGGPGGYRLLPRDADIASGPPGTPYLHYVSNETVEGLQFAQPPRLPGIALIADMSSDFLSRPIDFERHAMVYAHAQKNLGPAGVTVCVLDRELLERVPAGLPPMLDYRTHLRHGSNYNTPPVFGIYVLTLVTRWVRDSVGGIARMALRNRDKAQSLYDELECLEGFVNIHADPGFRSEMNASFRFGDPRLDGLFLEEAAAAGFSGLAGHRSLGGLRTSLYNAVSPAAVKQLCGFIRRFATRHG
jgi:phosphoserine aminotransferase